MRDTVLTHLTALFEAHRELASALPADAFAASMPVASNSIGQQFWCVVGARESYSKALIDGAWGGFTCSLQETGDQTAVVEALERSERVFADAVADAEWNDMTDGLLADLLEHESQHQGQLVRYVYALGYRFPDSWVARWSLQQP